MQAKVLEIPLHNALTSDGKSSPANYIINKIYILRHKCKQDTLDLIGKACLILGVSPV